MNCACRKAQAWFTRTLCDSYCVKEIPIWLGLDRPFSRYFVGWCSIWAFVFYFGTISGTERGEISRKKVFDLHINCVYKSITLARLCCHSRLKDYLRLPITCEKFVRITPVSYSALVFCCATIYGIKSSAASALAIGCVRSICALSCVVLRFWILL